MPNIRALVFSNDTVSQVDDAAAALAFYEQGATLWVDLVGRTREHEDLLVSLGLHPLTIEDVFADLERPKIEAFDRYLYFLFHAPARDEDDGHTEIDLAFGARFLVTHHTRASAPIDAVFDEVLRSSRLLQRGVAYVAHAVLDRVIDEYGPVLDKFDDEIDAIERDILEGESKDDTVPRIFSMKRKIQQIRRVAVNQKEVLHRLSRREFAQIPEALGPFYRDVYDHFARVYDLTESYRDLLGAALDAHLSVQSNRMNAIMKTLTLATTVFMPLTFIVGLYGMNFEHMPELKQKWAYPIVLIVMLVIATSVVLFYRKKKWI